MRRLFAALLASSAGCFSDPGAAETAATEPTTASPPATTTATATGAATTGPAAPVCGDGLVEGAEECDAGADNGEDGQVCRGDCRLHVCGDADLADGIEECDLGPYNGTGGPCSPTCTLNVCGDGYLGPGEGCDDGDAIDDAACTATCKLPGCGDGVPVPGEACDDGNDLDTDACTTLCQAARCGDGHVWTGTETCDDGNIDPSDACTDACVPAACGDGVQHVGVEGCDDGGVVAGDGCSDACAQERLRVFVTSERYDGALGGVAGADDRCAERVKAAGLQGLWLAWISDGTSTPLQRFSHGLPIVRMNGEAVADSLAALVALGAPDHAINFDETGTQIGNGGDCGDPSDKVWTNLNNAGEPAGDLHCAGWTSVDAGFVTPVGRANAGGGNWTQAECLYGCKAELRLYCFEQRL